MFTCEQWTRHDVKDGRCQRCQQAVRGQGEVYTRMGMTFYGNRQNAENCKGAA